MTGPSAVHRDTEDQFIDRDVLDGLLWRRMDEEGRDAERPLRLTEAEGLAIADLLDELSGVYAGEKLGRTARALSVRIYDRLGI